MIRVLFSVAKAHGYDAVVPPAQLEAAAAVAVAPPAQGVDGPKALWKLLKVLILAKSMHKGKAVQFCKEGEDVSFDHVSQLYEYIIHGGRGAFRVLLEHMTLSHSAFLDLVVSRATASAATPLSDDVQSRLARDLSYSSNAIEGNSSTTEEVDLIIAAGTADTEAAAEILGHYHVALALYQHPTSLASVSTGKIEEWHAGLQIAGLVADKVGRVRREGSPEVIIRSSAHRFAQSKDVPAKLEALWEWLRSVHVDLRTGIQVATEAHYRLLDIHPFADGNGRVSRLLMNAVLLAAGFPMTSLMPGMEDIYFSALRAADRGQGLQLLQRIIAEALWRSMELAAAVAGSAGRDRSARRSPVHNHRGVSALQHMQ